jgi:hypothetical protein
MRFGCSFGGLAVVVVQQHRCACAGFAQSP